MHDFFEIVGLSLSVSLAAPFAALAISLPLGTVLALFAFPGPRLAVFLINAFFGLPPVVVGFCRGLSLRCGPKDAGG
jgi:tungstate transport system permease protein